MPRRKSPGTKTRVVEAFSICQLGIACKYVTSSEFTILGMELALMTAGCLFYPLSNITIRYIVKTFNGLSTADVYLITEKLVGAVHAVISTGIGLAIIQQCENDILHDRHWATNMFAWFALPYFAYDVVAMFMTHFYLNEAHMAQLDRRRQIKHFIKYNWALMIHHVVLPAIFFPIVVFLRRNVGDYFIGMFYCCEAVIPFIAIRFILAQLNMKGTITYIFIGLLMIFMFFVSRILMFPFLYWKYANYAGIDFTSVPFVIPIKCNFGCLVILALQMHFMCLMFRGAYRVFSKINRANKNKNFLENMSNKQK